MFTFPEWPLLLTIFLGCALTGLQFVLLTFESLLALCGVQTPAPDGLH